MLAEKYDFFIFDQDGTIANRNSTVIFQSMVEFFRQIKGDGRIELAICSNKGGVGMGQWAAAFDDEDRPAWLTPERMASYPTRQQAMAEMHTIAIEIQRLSGKMPALYYSFQFQFQDGTWTQPDGEKEWAWNWHKPSPGMLKQALDDVALPPGYALMVGDRDEDRLAARDAGVDFMWAEEFWREVKENG